MRDVAGRLRMRRLELGLNKSQLARQAGICHSVITRIESGEYRYSRHLFRIADELGVSVDWLVRGNSPIGKYTQGKYTQ